MLRVWVRVALVLLVMSLVPQGGLGASFGSVKVTNELGASIDPSSGVSSLDLGSQIQQPEEVGTAQIRRVSAGALGFGNGETEILHSSIDAAILAPLPSSSWVIVPILAVLVVFVQRSAGKAI